MTIDNIPTPIRKSFAHPECLPDIPSTILAHPLKIRPIPTKIVTINAVAAGNEIARPANMSKLSLVQILQQEMYQLEILKRR